jgi:hypothetical protein
MHLLGRQCAVMASYGRIVVTIALLCGISAPIARASPIPSTRTCVNGVCLSLVLPSRTLIRNSLIRVTTIVENTGRTPISGPEMGGTIPEPQVQVLDGRGHLVFPPLLQVPPSLPSFKYPVSELFRGGAVIRSSQLVVVRGARLRVVLHFQRFGASGTERSVVRTALIRLLLRVGNVPHVVLQAGAQVMARVIPARNSGSGPLYHADWWSCRMPDGMLSYGGSGFYELSPPSAAFPPLLVGVFNAWLPARGTVLRPGCASPVEWHGVAGWLGRPVMQITYRRSIVRGG